jgi:hypothetical protein
MWEHNNKYILGMLVSQFYKKLHKNVSAMVSFLQSYPDESEYVLSCFSKMAFFFYNLIRIVLEEWNFLWDRGSTYYPYYYQCYVCRTRVNKQKCEFIHEYTISAPKKRI